MSLLNQFKTSSEGPFRDRRKVEQNKGDFYARPSFKSAVGLRNISPSQQGQKLMGGTQSCTKGQRESNHASRDTDIGDENKERIERMNKYKERRRRQLASKYADWSSSEDITSVGDEPSFVRFSNKYTRHSKTNATKSPYDKDREDGIVRSNKASRLRALTVNGQENAVDLMRSASFRTKNDDDFHRGISNRRSFNGTLPSISDWKNNTPSQVFTTYVSSSDTTSTHDSTQKSRDKSGKRKSNLNRSLIADVNQDLSRDANSELRWNRANNTDKLSGVVLSEGNTFRSPLRAELDMKSREKQSGMKRPKIPPIFLQDRGNRAAHCDAAVDSDIRHPNSAMSHGDSIENNAAKHVNQLAQLVQETTAKVDSLTYVAAGSSDSGGNLQSPIVEDGSSIKNVCAKFPSFVAPPTSEREELRNGTSLKYTVEKEVTRREDAGLDLNRLDKNGGEKRTDDRIIVPLPVFNGKLAGDADSHVAQPGEVEPFPSDFSKSQSVVDGGTSETEETPHHGILKRTSSSDGGDPKPILKKRSSIDEPNDQPKPILKIHRSDDGSSTPLSCEEQDGNTDLRSILKRQQRYNEPPSSILKISAEKKEDEENRNSECEISLRPSILKKKCKEVHPLATPFTELASILKPKQTTRVKSPIEIFQGVDDKRRMSVAERIMQMETKLADETERTPTPPLIMKDLITESGYAVKETSPASRFDGISSRRVRERFSARYRTQPITFDEVKMSIDDSGENGEKEKETIENELKVETRFTVNVQRSQVQKDIPTNVGPTDRESNAKPDDSDEDPCKMSLAERVSFFDRKVVEEKLARNKSAATQYQYSRKRSSSRFKTQPITIAEVEKAQQLEMGETETRNGEVKEMRQTEENDYPLVCHSPPKVHPPIPRGKATIILSSSNDEDSSGPGFHEGRRVIKNDAINRRRNAALRRQDERRSMCDLYSGVGTEPSRTPNLHQRSNTAPLTKFELDRHEDSAAEVVSIADRLAALRKSGEENWRDRIRSKDEILFKKQTVTINNTTDVAVSDASTYQSLASIREKRRSREERPSSIVDRISQLGVAQQDWKQRVEEKDSTQFTVAGRMGCVESDSQITERVRRVPTASVFTSNSPMMIPLQRSVSEPVCNLPVIGDKRMSRVVVPKIDDESFHAFFESTHRSEKTLVEISDDGFQHMTTTSREMLVQKKDVARQRRPPSRNPIKMLASRSDIQNEYEENVTELNKLRAQQIAKTNNLAVSALAGLASSEDFSAITLKKGSPVASGSFLPHKDLMLIQVKGRRHVQTRLVEPNVTSMNRGDNYVLVTPNQVFNWIGRFSNVIERSKGSEVASIIQSKHDLGYSSSSPVIIIDEEQSSQHDGYFQLLGGEAANVCEADNPKGDEIYENAIINTNMVYEVEADRLVPHPKCWGTLPKIELLECRKVLVFDFGSEMYVWQGKLSPIGLRKIAVHLAQELWNQGYNYSECVINPLCPTGVKESLPKRQTQRPSWCLFAKVNQHMETVLFREKFVDWPECQNIIKVKTPEKNKLAPTSPLCSCDVGAMLEDDRGEPDLILEGSHIGRGKSYWDADSRRHYEITNLGIKVWHVDEKNYKLLPRESWSQFYTGDTNVVRWQYMITVTGRDLSGQMSRHSFVGRERCAYFFWQGAESTVNDKGTSALMTIELNEERGPDIRVNEGHEPPCFLGLFDGAMMVHRGKRKFDQNRDDDIKLYVLRNPVESESCLIEVEPARSSLRSRSSLVFVDVPDGLICAWHGAKSSLQLKQAASAAAEILRERRPIEIGFEYNLPLRLEEITEGEDQSLLSKLGDDEYDSLLTNPLTFDFTPRLFHMSSVSGTFCAVEITCSFRSSHFRCPFPFVQSDLYGADQPALFILDDEYRVYLWQGWWPEPSDDNDNVATGSAKVRWNADRRCAMETVLNYCKEKDMSSPPSAYLVSAGLEPLSFINIFPSWEPRHDVTALNVQDGRRKGECIAVDDVLTPLSRTRFTIDELQDRPLPEGVDPSRIESYLNDTDFEEAVGMIPAEFYVLPAWKQNEIKKRAHLF